MAWTAKRTRPAGAWLGAGRGPALLAERGDHLMRAAIALAGSRAERALTAAGQGRVIQEVHVALQGGRFAIAPNARLIAEA